MFIKRDLVTEILKAKKHFPVIVLTGARQVGKSTLLKHAFPNHTYVSLDRPLDAEEAEHDPELFLSKHKLPIIIDEVQYAPKIFRYIKSVVDRQQNLQGHFVLTGSQKFSLMQEVSESLAGRVALFELEGLSLNEIKNALSWAPTLENYLDLLIKGGFPKLWAVADTPQKLFYSSYVGTYLERDIRQVLAVTSLRDFERLMRACAIRTAQVLNKSDLAREIGVSVSTVSEWINVLVALGHVVLLEPWFNNLGKRLSKSPKLYLTDTGLISFLTGIDKSSIVNSPMIGSIWETFVFAELRKQIRISDRNISIWHYRDQSQNEVDFVLQSGSNVTLIECKWTSEPSLKHGKNLHTVEKVFLKNKYLVTEKIIVSRATQTIKRDKGVVLRPASENLLFV
jgi:uncharacterized protein